LPWAFWILEVRLPRFLRYIAVGAGSFVLDYVVFLFCLRLLGIAYLLANATGFVCGFLASFYFHGRYTFDLEGGLGKHFLRYCLLAQISLVLGSLVLFLLVQGLELAPEWGKILVALLTVCWNFLLYRFFVFRKATA